MRWHGESPAIPVRLSADERLTGGVAPLKSIGLDETEIPFIQALLD
ncbi:hypothetical protein [Nitrosomonas mobilis]|nr:hypothetical protein [Nitrosomonas mobilis]